MQANELQGTITFVKNNYGFITTQLSSGDKPVQFFFHFSNFKTGQRPVLGACVCFRLGQPIRLGQKVQAIGVRLSDAPSMEGALSVLSGAQ
jgi:cold shock CspA family protein